MRRKLKTNLHNRVFHTELYDVIITPPPPEIEQPDTQNEGIFEAGDAFSKASFLVSMLDFWGVYMTHGNFSKRVGICNLHRWCKEQLCVMWLKGDTCHMNQNVLHQILWVSHRQQTCMMLSNKMLLHSLQLRKPLKNAGSVTIRPSSLGRSRPIFRGELALSFREGTFQFSCYVFHASFVSLWFADCLQVHFSL